MLDDLFKRPDIWFNNCVERMLKQMLKPFKRAFRAQEGCGFFWGGGGGGESKNGFVISDHSDHGAPKEPTNPCPEWIRRFL